MSTHFTLTRESFSVITQATKLFEMMPLSQTIVVYLHLPQKGWYVVDARNGETISIRDYEACGYEIIKNLPSVETDEVCPQDGEELYKLFTLMHQDYVKASKPTGTKSQLTFIDADNEKPPLKWEFINKRFD